MQEEDILSKIEKGIANEEVPNEEILKDAELLVNQLYGKPQKSSRTFWLAFQSAALACIVLLIGVFFFVDFFKPHVPDKPETRYFDEESIVISDISDLAQYLMENSININYFIDCLGKNKVANITDTKELALITQSGLMISETSFDQIELCINLIPNATYEKLNPYKDMVNEITIEGINVKYENTSTSDGMTVIMAKFTIEKDYYLQITTVNPDGKLKYYIKTLIGK